MKMVVCTSSAGSKYIAGIFVKEPDEVVFLAKLRARWAEVEVWECKSFVPPRPLQLEGTQCR